MLSHLNITKVQRGVNALPIFETRNSRVGEDATALIEADFRFSNFEFRFSFSTIG
jgi:hypothetical protein